MKLPDQIAQADDGAQKTRTGWWVVRCLAAAVAAAWVTVLVFMFPR